MKLIKNLKTLIKKKYNKINIINLIILAFITKKKSYY